MPGFVNSPEKEKRWSKAKKAAGKETKDGSEGFYKLSNYIFHKMGKTEEDMFMAEKWKSELLKSLGSLPSDPMKVGTQATVKMPKAKKPADGFGPPSKFFKSEELQQIKKPSVKKLQDFLEKVRTK